MPILYLFGMVFEWHDHKFALVHQNRGISLEPVHNLFNNKAMKARLVN